MEAVPKKWAATVAHQVTLAGVGKGGIAASEPIVWTDSGLPSQEGPQDYSLWDWNTDASLLLAPMDGYYRLDGWVRCDAISPNTYPARFGGEVLRNGSRLHLWGYGYANAGQASMCNLSHTFGMNAGDTIQVTLGPAGGATSLTLTGGYAGTRIQWSYVGAK